jgi:hypothetical protein
MEYKQTNQDGPEKYKSHGLFVNVVMPVVFDQRSIFSNTYKLSIIAYE